DLNFTGLGNYSRFILKALSDHYPQHNYLLYSPEKSFKNQEVTEACDNSNQQTISPEGVWKLPFMSGLWRSVYSGQTHSKKNLDIFHGLSNEIPLKKDNRTRYVVTIHDLIYLRFPELYHPIDVRIYKFKAKFSCEAADKVIAVSNQTA